MTLIDPSRIFAYAQGLVRQHDADSGAHPSITRTVEGTYTPTITGLPASSIQLARYTKIGHLCTVTLYWTCTTPVAVDVTITLPFDMASAARADIIGLGVLQGYRNGSGIAHGIIAASATANLVKIRATGASTWWSGTYPSAWAAGDIFGCTFTYPTV